MSVQNNKNGKNSLLNFLDSVFYVNAEMIENKGEDSFALSVNDRMGMIGVFDGCGGIGSRKYLNYDNKTGAYISSRVTSEVFTDWFKRYSSSNQVFSSKNLQGICDELYTVTSDSLKTVESGTNASIIKGALTKSFPTTASVILFSNSDKETMRMGYIWAGDSRGFILTPDGLQQITKDDLEDDGDAYENVSNDSKLSNMVCASGDYHFNYRPLTCRGAGVLITCTDGCFGYFSTPMEVEYMLLDCLQKSECINEWKANIHNYIRKFAGDDYTMCVAVFGYKNFKSLKKSYMARHETMFNTYISKISNASDEEKALMWNQYKKGYYRGV